MSLTPTKLEKLAIIKYLGQTMADWCEDPMVEPDDLSDFAIKALEWIKTLKGYTGKPMQER